MNSLTYQLIGIVIAFVLFIVLVLEMVRGNVRFNGNSRPFSYGISDDFMTYVIAIIISGSGLWPIIVAVLLYAAILKKTNKPSR